MCERAQKHVQMVNSLHHTRQTEILFVFSPSAASLTCACVQVLSAGCDLAGSPPGPSSCQCSSPCPERGREGTYEVIKRQERQVRLRGGNEMWVLELEKTVRGPVRHKLWNLFRVFLSHSTPSSRSSQRTLFYEWWHIRQAVEHRCLHRFFNSPQGCLPRWCSCRHRPVRLQQCAGSRFHQDLGWSCSARSS